VRREPAQSWRDRRSSSGRNSSSRGTRPGTAAASIRSSTQLTVKVEPHRDVADESARARAATDLQRQIIERSIGKAKRVIDSRPH
jgi:hypothetical protein